MIPYHYNINRVYIIIHVYIIYNYLLMKEENNNNNSCLNHHNSINKSDDYDRLDIKNNFSTDKKETPCLISRLVSKFAKSWTLIFTFIFIIYFYYIYMFVKHI